MRNLASIQKITALEPISGADSIEKAVILGWSLVVKRNEFRVGELCVYCEIDSIMPEKPEFEFLRERKFRIKTIKLRGCISQGIAFPLSILPPKTKIEEGLDVTEILEITKFEPYKDDPKLAKQGGKIAYPKWMPKFLVKILHRFKFVREYYRRTSGQKTFPSLIPKSDETRCIYGNAMIITEHGEKTMREICEKKYKGRVLSYNELGDKLEFKRILSHNIQRNNNDWYEIVFENGKRITATDNHRFYYPETKSYRLLRDLKIGDKLLFNK